MMNSSISQQQQQQPLMMSRYESQKRRDWNTFGQYLKNHRPPLVLYRCSGAHILEFLRYLDQFGKTKVHNNNCPFFGHPQPNPSPAPCPCPLRQAWGSLDALIGRLRAAFDENTPGHPPDTNPFGSRAVRLYLREVRDSQAKARGIAYQKKKKRKTPPLQPPPPPLPPQPPSLINASSLMVLEEDSSSSSSSSSSIRSMMMRSKEVVFHTHNTTTTAALFVGNSSQPNDEARGPLSSLSAVLN